MLMRSSQRSDAQRVCNSRHNFPKENIDKSRKFTLTAKLNAVSEKLFTSSVLKMK